jgi:uncharacterized membrane protein
MTAQAAEPQPSEDAGRGLALFVIFTAAALIVTAAVALLALDSAWWVLGFVFGLHVLMTTVVGRAIYRAMDGSPTTV